jgi:hypothetical protein
MSSRTRCNRLALCMWPVSEMVSDMGGCAQLSDPRDLSAALSDRHDPSAFGQIPKIDRTLGASLSFSLPVA